MFKIYLHLLFKNGAKRPGANGNMSERTEGENRILGKTTWTSLKWPYKIVLPFLVQ